MVIDSRLVNVFSSSTPDRNNSLEASLRACETTSITARPTGAQVDVGSRRD